MLQAARAVAIRAGHDPRETLGWAEGDLLHLLAATWGVAERGGV